MLTRMFTPFPILKTNRLTLRQVAMKDEWALFTLRSDREINKYLDRQLSESIDQVRNFINRIRENISKNDSLYWAITLSNQDVLVGTICLLGLSDETDKCEIGYELLTTFQGQGIMKEAAEIVIEYAFNTLNGQEIKASLHRDNQRSIKLLEKLSFRHSHEADSTDPDLLCYHLKKSN